MANFIDHRLSTTFKNLTKIEISQLIKNQKQFLKGNNQEPIFLLRYDLRFADFSNADLRCIDLNLCDLRGVDFTNTILSFSSITNCDLRGAKFEGATVSGVDFSGSDLRGVDVSGFQLALVSKAITS